MLSKDNNKILIDRIKEKDKCAFEEFYNKYSGKIYRFVLSVTYNPNLAEDITQSCFLTIWEKAEYIDGDKNIESYIFTIARNLAYKEIQRQILTHEYVELGDEEHDDYIEENLNVKYLESYINKLFRALPPVAYKIYLLRKDRGLSSREIAKRLNLSERSVEAYIYRSFKYLRENLKKLQVLLICVFNC